MARKPGVYGASDLSRSMRRIGQLTGGMNMSGVRARALVPMQEAAKENLVANKSVHRKVLYNGIDIEHRSDDVTILGLKKGAAPIAHLVEWGTAPHYQPNRNGGSMHPGAAPHPFMVPAFEATKERVARIATHELNGAFQRILTGQAKPMRRS